MILIHTLYYRPITSCNKATVPSRESQIIGTHTVCKNCDKTRNQRVITLRIISACESLEFYM